MAIDETVVEQTPEPKAAPKSRGIPRWETLARERVKHAIKFFHKPLCDLVERDANEADTRLLVTDFLCEGLGFGKYADLSTEYRVRGDYADYAIRIDNDVLAFVEVKRVNTKLGIKHLRQVQSYAVNEGVEWIILTNGAQWQVYHLTGGLPLLTEKALEIDLLADNSASENINGLFHISREALKRGRLSDLWQAKHATSPKSLAGAMLSDPVIASIRKELRRVTGYNVDAEQVADLLRSTCLREDCFETVKKRNQ